MDFKAKLTQHAREDDEMQVVYLVFEVLEDESEKVHAIFETDQGAWAYQNHLEQTGAEKGQIQIKSMILYKDEYFEEKDLYME